MATEKIETFIDDDFDDPTPIDIATEADDEDVDVEIVDDTPVEDRGRTPPANASDDDSDDDLESYSKSVQKRIKKLRYDFHEERRHKEAAERQNTEAVRVAQQLREENLRLRQSQAQSDTALLDQAKQRAEIEIQSAKAEYSKAYEEGDTEAIVSSQEKLSRAIAEKQSLESRAPVYYPEPEPEQQVEYQQRQRPAPDPKAQEWLQKNTWFGRNKVMTGFAYGLHEKLIEEDGLDPRSNAYYDRINSEMRKQFPDHFGESADVDERGHSPRRSVVASASRTGSKSRTVRLTATQVALAKRLGLTAQEYAKELVKEQYSE